MGTWQKYAVNMQMNVLQERILTEVQDIAKTVETY